MDNTEMLDNTSEEMQCDNCEPICPECEEVDGPMPDLPPGIKTEAVLMLLGNLSKALGDIVASINGTVTQIITEGTNQSVMNQTEGDSNE